MQEIWAVVKKLLKCLPIIILKAYFASVFISAFNFFDILKIFLDVLLKDMTIYSIMYKNIIKMKGVWL